MEPPTENLLAQVNAEIASVVQKVAPSLVKVRSRGRGYGSGILCHSDGLLITNAHVVGSPDLEVILPDGREFPARLLARDPSVDLAALYVEASGLPTAELGESQTLRPGQPVLALGHPWGVSGAVIAGVIISTTSGWPGAGHKGINLIAVDLPLRPGNSGGPLVDFSGRVVGINSMIAGPDVGLAVPVHTVKAFLQKALGSRKPIAF